MAITGLGVLGQWVFSAFRLRKLSVGPAKLSLGEAGGTYFDQYLDELVYFFQRTRTQVVVFEDRDRFDDPGLFRVTFVPNERLDNKNLVYEQSPHMVRQKFGQTIDVMFRVHDSEGATLGTRYRAAQALARAPAKTATSLRSLAGTDFPRASCSCRKTSNNVSSPSCKSATNSPDSTNSSARPNKPPRNCAAHYPQHKTVRPPRDPCPRQAQPVEPPGRISRAIRR